MSSAMDEARMRENQEKKEILELLNEQVQEEGKLVGLYEKSHKMIKNRPVRHLLHMIQLDSMKHIDICQTVIEILQGEDVLGESKQEIIGGLREHVELEEGSLKRADKILKSVWIKENKALVELIKKLRDDEKVHHEMLKRLSKKPFFRLEYGDYTLFNWGMEYAEERYKKSKDYRKRQSIKE